MPMKNGPFTKKVMIENTREGQTDMDIEIVMKCSITIPSTDDDSMCGSYGWYSGQCQQSLIFAHSFTSLCLNSSLSVIDLILFKRGSFLACFK